MRGKKSVILITFQIDGNIRINFVTLPKLNPTKTVEEADIVREGRAAIFESMFLMSHFKKF